MTNWNGYEPYVPLHTGLRSALTRVQARESFKHLMAAKEERIEQLRQLLAVNSVVLSPSDDGVQELNDWFRVSVESNPESPHRLRNLWYAVVNDIALFLGDVILSRCPGLRWEMFSSGKRDVAFQKHVIVGFTSVPNPRYYIDVDGAVASYGTRIIEGNPVERNLFLRMLREAEADA